MKPEKSKLAIFINAYFYFDGESYYTNDNIIIFYLKTAKEFANVLIFAPIQHKNIINKKNLYKISDTRVEFVAIPYYTGRTYSLLKTGHKTVPSLFKTLKLLRGEFDMLWQIDCPNPLNLVFNLFCKRMKIPIIFFIRQDIISILKAKYKGPKKYFSILIAKIIDAYNRRLLKKYPAFVIGHKLYLDYKNKDSLVYEIEANLLGENDIIASSQLIKKDYTGKLEILGVGRFGKEKGFIYLLQAIELLVNTYREDVHLTLIGEGYQEDELREYIHVNRLQNYIDIVTFMKHGEDFFNYFKKADLFVQPSLTEGFPKTIFEAMTNGAALVVTRVGDMPYIVKEGVNGLIVEPQNAASLAEAILHYKHNPHLLKSVTLYNLNYVKQFVFEKQKNVILEVVEKL